MSSPISNPGVSPVGPSWKLYPTSAEETLDTPNTSRSLCQGTNQQASTIARYTSSENLTEQNLDIKLFFKKHPPVKPPFLDWNSSSRTLANSISRIPINGIVNLMEAGGIQHNFTPTEAQEFVEIMRAIQRPIENKTTRNREEDASTIEFRPKCALVDIHNLGLFLGQKGGFAGCFTTFNQKSIINEKKYSYSAIALINFQDLVRQRYKQIWQDLDLKNSEEYEIPNSGYPNSTTWFQKKKTVDQLEKELSYQERFLQRAINMMNSKQKESDKEIPFDPAFRRIFIMTEKERKANWDLPTQAIATGVFFEYKTQIVPLEQERTCIEEINAMPARKINEIKKAIKDDLREHPIETVDLHQISHLLEKLGGYVASSALIEKKYTIDRQERHCTAIVLRNRQDLVEKRYACLREKYRTQHDLPDRAPVCNYPVPFLQKKKTPKEAQKQLFSQTQLLQRAVQKMYIDEQPFDPLFERIYVPTDQERINNGSSISHLAQTDTILFVYRTSEDRPQKYAVEQICAWIKITAEREEKTSTKKTSRADQTCLSLLTRAARLGRDFFP